jgi:acyl-CoA synthetase (AMP-forming)/AMP-acid ligase II
MKFAIASHGQIFRSPPAKPGFTCWIFKDMITRGGVNIYPAEIEQILNDLPAIKDTAEIGRPDEYWGEIVVAFIVVDKNMNISKQSIRQYCEERIAKIRFRPCSGLSMKRLEHLPGEF